MTFNLPKSVAAVGILGIAASSAALAVEPKQVAAPPSKELQAKIEYCKTCHGANGQGYRGATPMPRLAGQQTEYFQNQLKAFIEKRRENRFMYGVAHVLSPEMLNGLANYFNGLNPKPLGGGSRDLIAEGHDIFVNGIDKASVPACASCHGDDAKGNGLFPRLAGQLPDYIVKNLTSWEKERGRDPKNPDNSAMMAPIAHNLTEAQMKAVAAYLSFLE